MVIPPLPPLDFIDPLYLIKLAQGVKSRRDGSILSRSFILKSEFRIDRREAPLEAVNLRGATSFRYAGSLGVYGCAQPTKTGLRTVLSVLKSKNTVDENGLKKLGKETIWFSTREEPIVSNSRM